MERTEIDGVRVLWMSAPVPFQATLMFGCGVRDEEFRTTGVTHLVEHLAMSALPRLYHDHNASVDLETTRFTAVGQPDQIATFLNAICTILGDLPTDRVEQEAGVLAAESGFAVHPSAAAALNRRFGLRGYGLEAYTGPGFDRIDVAAIRAHAARYFVAGNAVLLLTGEPPAGLRLPLPAGPRVSHDLTGPVHTDGPRWSAEPTPMPCLALRGARHDPAWTVAMAVLSERLAAEARHEKGLSYEINGCTVDLSDTEADRLVWASARQGREAEVARIIWDTAVVLATDGPTAEEIHQEARAAWGLLADPRSVEDMLSEAGRATLFGWPYRELEAHAADLATVTPADVSVRLTAAMGTALLVVPPETRVELTDVSGRPVAEGGCPRLPHLPAGRLFKTPLLARALSGACRALRLVLTTDGIAQRDPEGIIHEVRFDEVVGVQINGDESRSVFGRNGCTVVVDLDVFPGAAAVVRAIDERVPERLRYRQSELIAEEQPP